MKITTLVTSFALAFLLTSCGGDSSSNNKTPSVIEGAQLVIDTSQSFYAAYRLTSNTGEASEWTVLEPKLHSLKPLPGKDQLELVTLCYGEGGADWTVVRATLDRGVAVPDYRCFRGKPAPKNKETTYKSATEEFNILRGHTPEDYQPGTSNLSIFYMNFVEIPEKFDAMFTASHATTEKTYLYIAKNFSPVEDEEVLIDFSDSEKVTELATHEYIFLNNLYAFDSQYRYPTQNNNYGLVLKTVGALSNEKINFALIPDSVRVPGDSFSQFWKDEDRSYELNRITSQQTFEPNIPEIIQPTLTDNISLDADRNLQIKTQKISDEFTLNALKIRLSHQIENQYSSNVTYYAYNSQQLETLTVEPFNFQQLPGLDINLLLADFIYKGADGQPTRTLALPPTVVSTEIITQATALFATETYPAINSALLTIDFKEAEEVIEEP